MDTPGDAENFLCSRDGCVVDPSRPENIESGTEPGAGEEGEPRAACSAMQIQTKIRRKAADRACARGQGARHIRVVCIHGREAIFHHDGYLEVRPGMFEKLNGGRREHTVTERSQADHDDTAAWREPVECVSLSGH